MAKAKISLIFNVKTGKKDIIVDYESDSDSLPIEHEKEHRNFIETLIGKNLIKAEEAGEVIIKRGSEALKNKPDTRNEDIDIKEEEAGQN